MPKREANGKGRICGNACFTQAILLFSLFWGSIWDAKMREKQNGIPIWMKTRFYGDLGSVLRFIMESNSDEKNIENSMDLKGIPGETLF